jgi:hypothetical protein
MTLKTIKTVFFYLTVAVAMTLGQSLTFAQGLKFQTVFSEKGEPRSVHYLAKYQTQNSQHDVEVWRLGNRQFKKRTDDAIEIVGIKKSGHDEYTLHVFDLKKRIYTQIDRDNLIKIGNITDWYEMSHALKFPRGDYALVKFKPVKEMPPTAYACDWYSLTQSGSTSKICWSQTNKLPISILNHQDQIVWQIVLLDHKADEQSFSLNRDGFVFNNANRDIEGD